MIEIKYTSEFAAFFDERFLDKNQKNDDNKPLKHGLLYKLSENSEDKYMFIDIVNTINEIEINSLIMKQVNESKTKIFTLTKSDCDFLGINFEPGLQLFPIKTKFIPEKNEFIFNDFFNHNDLSTYPCCIVDNTIKRIIIKLNDFIANNKNQLVWLKYPHTNIVGINIKPKINLKTYKDVILFNTNDVIKYNLIQYKYNNFQQNKPLTFNDYVDENCNLYLELLLERHYYNNITKAETVGINPDTLKNLRITDLFNINILYNLNNCVTNKIKINYE